LKAPNSTAGMIQFPIFFMRISPFKKEFQQ
jgi:hypothetical protein